MERRPGREVTAIEGNQVVLRPLEQDDLEFVRRALEDPSVARWWDVGEGIEWVDEVLQNGDIAAYVVEAGSTLIGYTQWSEETDPGYRHAAIDVFIASAAQGNGHGRDAVRTLARWLFDVRGHHRLEIDPAADNDRAIRCYQAVGFRPIGIARRRERTPTGEWRDSLLMDLLADELR